MTKPDSKRWAEVSPYLDEALELDTRYGDMPSSLEGNWALSLLVTGRAQEVDHAILDAAARAEKGGITFQSAILRASVWIISIQHILSLRAAVRALPAGAQAAADRAAV